MCIEFIGTPIFPIPPNFCLKGLVSDSDSPPPLLRVLVRMVSLKKNSENVVGEMLRFMTTLVCPHHTVPTTSDLYSALSVTQQGTGRIYPHVITEPLPPPTECN